MLKHSVARMIERYGLLIPGAPVGVALSGGADSVALLSVLTSLGYQCVALHCNFHLRGAESDRDELHARTIARQLGARIEVEHFNVDQQRLQSGESVEMACRSLRYRWFENQVRQLGLQALALGHHRDDNVETLLLNLLRGSGVRGARGMLPRRDIYIRPMLECSREDILDYLKRHNLDYVTDSSNLTDHYRRNKLRHHILPALEREFPGAVEALARSMEIMRGQSAMLDGERQLLKERYAPHGAINLAALLADSPGRDLARARLYELLADDGFNADTIDSILDDPTGSGRRFEGKSGWHELHRGQLLPVDEAPDTEAVEFHPLRGLTSPIRIDSEVTDPGSLPPDCGRTSLALDYSCVATPAHWELRHWRPGDRMRPYGMRGARLVSDLYAEQGVPSGERSHRWVLTRDGEVVWAIGTRGGAHFPISKKTVRQIVFFYRENL